MLVKNIIIMARFDKYITILKKYSIFKTLCACFKIPHPRAASIVVAKKAQISLGKAASVNLPAGRLLIGESDTPTKQRFQSTELILDDGAKMMCAGDLILYEELKCVLLKTQNAPLDIIPISIGLRR